MLQAGKSRIRVPISSLNFSIYTNNSTCTMVLGLTQPLTEMSTGNLPRGKGRPTSVSQLSRKCGNFDVSQHYVPPRPVTGIVVMH
jgi:hypothetical protein